MLHITTELNDDIRKLLHENIIGTPGSGMLYQHKTVATRIAQIKAPYFIQLRTKTSLVGTCCFCFRQTLNNQASSTAFYIRYFSFKEKYRARRLSQEKTRAGRLREQIKNLFEQGRSKLPATEKHFYYAYVDPRNKRSALLCKEFGFQEVRRFSTFIFSRLNPKVDANVFIHNVSPHEVDEVKKLLSNRYSDFNMVPREELVLTESYYIIKDKAGRIVAGAQASPAHWKIYKMHNTLNTLLLSIFSRLPLLNRLINKDFKFLAVDGLFFTEGCEHYTEVLFSFLLKKYNHYNAFIPADNNSSLYRHLQKLDHGIVGKISKQVSTSVICRFNNFSPEEIDRFKQHPAYVSALDIT